MEHILVTGGAGFIGSNFVRYLLETEPDVHIVNLDLLTYAGSLENLVDLPDPKRHTFIKGDICDQELVTRLLRKHNINKVIHLAAETHVDRSVHGPAEFIQTNVVGTFTLLEAVKEYWLNEQTFSESDIRFHHVSTDEVYGTLEPEDPPFTETTPYVPNSPYSASKAASDHLVRAYHTTYGLPISITNCSNNYGPYQFPEKLIPLMILNAINGKELPIYGDGNQIRDWLYVEDHCETIWRVVQNGEPGETYNVGGNNQPTNLTVVKTICEILDECTPSSPYIPHENLIRHVSDRPGHDRRYDVDITKIKHALDWQPEESLTTGLLRTVEWYINNPDWIQAIQKRGGYQMWMQQNYADRGSDK